MSFLVDVGIHLAITAAAIGIGMGIEHHYFTAPALHDKATAEQALKDRADADQSEATKFHQQAAAESRGMQDARKFQQQSIDADAKNRAALAAQLDADTKRVRDQLAAQGSNRAGHNGPGLPEAAAGAGGGGLSCASERHLRDLADAAAASLAERADRLADRARACGARVRSEPQASGQ